MNHKKKQKYICNEIEKESKLRKLQRTKRGKRKRTIKSSRYGYDTSNHSYSSSGPHWGATHTSRFLLLFSCSLRSTPTSFTLYYEDFHHSHECVNSVFHRCPNHLCLFSSKFDNNGAIPNFFITSWFLILSILVSPLHPSSVLKTFYGTNIPSHIAKWSWSPLDRLTF